MSKIRMLSPTRISRRSEGGCAAHPATRMTPRNRHRRHVRGKPSLPAIPLLIATSFVGDGTAPGRFSIAAADIARRKTGPTFHRNEVCYSHHSGGLHDAIADLGRRLAGVRIAAHGVSATKFRGRRSLREIQMGRDAGASLVRGAGGAHYRGEGRTVAAAHRGGPCLSSRARTGGAGRISDLSGQGIAPGGKLFGRAG